MIRTQKFYHSHLETKGTYNIQVYFDFDSDAAFGDLSIAEKRNYETAAYKALSNHPDYTKVNPIEVWLMDFREE